MDKISINIGKYLCYSTVGIDFLICVNNTGGEVYNLIESSNFKNYAALNEVPYIKNSYKTRFVPTEHNLLLVNIENWQT